MEKLIRNPFYFAITERKNKHSKLFKGEESKLESHLEKRKERCFVMFIVLAVVAAVGTDVDGSQGTVGMVC